MIPQRRRFLLPNCRPSKTVFYTIINEVFSRWQTIPKPKARSAGPAGTNMGYHSRSLSPKKSLRVSKDVANAYKLGIYILRATQKLGYSFAVGEKRKPRKHLFSRLSVVQKYGYKTVHIIRGTFPADQGAPGARERPHWPEADSEGLRPGSDRGGPGGGGAADPGRSRRQPL